MNVYIENVFKEYNGRRVLDIDKLTLEKGKVYAVLGLNGSGKSALLECIAGLQQPDGGRILYDNNLTLDLISNKISMMTQKPYLFNKTVLENIMSGLEYRKIPKLAIKERVEQYLDYLDIDELLNKNAKKLSGGEAAKTALLRTAVLETNLTILDEPTASMDMESTLRAEKLIKDMAKKDRTVVFVTHDLYQAQRIANEVVFMDRGRILEQGSKNAVFTNPQSSLLKMMLNQKVG